METNRFKEFRLTLLLYAGLLILPFGWYLNYGKCTQTENVAAMLEVQSGLESDLWRLRMAGDGSKNVDEQRIYTALSVLEEWLKHHETDERFVGGRGLTLHLRQVRSCLKTSADMPAEKFMRSCWNPVHAAGFALHKMQQLLLEDQRRMLFVTFIGMIIYLVLLIYFVRLLIEMQIKKHAIVDAETSLFSRKYFDTVLQLNMALALRKKEPLSLVCFRVEGRFDEAQKKVLIDFAAVLRAAKRKSDVGCRYNENTIVAILPNTAANEAKILLGRLDAEIAREDIGPIETRVAEIAENDTEEKLVDRLFDGCGK